MNCQNNNYRVIVDLNAIVNNAKNVEKSYNVKVMGVIKANAYGHMVSSLWHEPLNLKDLIDNDIDISVGSFFTLDRIVSIANGCDKSV